MLLVNCPHCTQLIEVEQLNCCIFRCGIYRNNGEQIQPHLNKSECDRLFEQQEIYGCGKPFRIIQDDSSNTSEEKNQEINYKAIICDYI
jgi:hypothetical protein